jgi:lipopolysaccharide/colanic/teichoic acid biosynthesis glycosyltransferase
MAKRLFDLFVSSAGILLLALPCAVIAMAVKLSSPGPVFHRQRRVGQGGKLFWFLKFRTMRVNEGGAQITVEGDKRITWVGAVLRRTKMDELPQLWSIWRGDMSIIGPRPEVERFVQQYNGEQRAILKYRPGLASVAQLIYPHEAEMLHGFANPEEVYVRELMPRKIAADLDYERRRTFWSDLQLIGEIVLLILGKSYRRDESFRLTAPGTTAQENSAVRR